MAAPFPQRYEVTVEALPRHAAKVVAPPRPQIVGGAPAEFDGHDGWWSPEHLLLSSAALCFALTFEALARRAQFLYGSLHCEAVGLLDKAPDGLRFIEIALKAKLDATGADAGKGRELLESAKTRCLVTNSLKARVTLEIIVDPDGKKTARRP